MITNYLPVLIVTGVIIILALSIYAGKLLKQVKLQRIQQQKNKEIQLAQLSQHDKKVLSSVTIIVRAMREEQCDVSEGCWRLCVLLESLKSITTLTDKFPAIFELYASIKHLSILEERKQLTKQQRMKQDVERMKVESKLIESIKTELELLQSLTELELKRLTTH